MDPSAKGPMSECSLREEYRKLILIPFFSPLVGEDCQDPIHELMGRDKRPGRSVRCIPFPKEEDWPKTIRSLVSAGSWR